jgi:hypothetical protein
MLTIDSAQQKTAIAAGVDANLLKGCPADKLINTILKDMQNGYRICLME